ncbi:MAG: 30S ribosomal protein S9 [Candidatus Shapirobacteria bacterium]|jgi:small subunit ribosomal protein S9
MVASSKTTANRYTYAYGRRKSAVATVKLFSKDGDSTVNTLPIAKYFASLRQENVCLLPFTATNTVGKYHFIAKVVGGGKSGQSEALSLAISRCLQKIDKVANTPLLRQFSLLTVDSRVRERRMIGTGGKARRQKQSPKR